MMLSCSANITLNFASNVKILQSLVFDVRFQYKDKINYMDKMHLTEQNLTGPTQFCIIGTLL